MGRNKNKAKLSFPTVSQPSKEVTKPYEKLASATDSQTHGGLCFVPLFLLGNEKRKDLFLITVDPCAFSCVFMKLRVFPHNSRQLQRKSPKSV